MKDRVIIIDAAGVERHVYHGDTVRIHPDPVVLYLLALATRDREDADAEWAKLNATQRVIANDIIKGIIAHGVP